MAKASPKQESESIINQAVSYVQRLGFESIRALHPDFEAPAILERKGEGESVEPCITALKNGAKFYFEIADKTISEKETVSKWKLLAALADMKKGELRIFVPYGNMKFTTDVVDRKNIKAQLIKLNR